MSTYTTKVEFDEDLESWVFYALRNETRIASMPGFMSQASAEAAAKDCMEMFTVMKPQ